MLLDSSECFHAVFFPTIAVLGGVCGRTPFCNVAYSSSKDRLLEQDRVGTVERITRQHIVRSARWLAHERSVRPRSAFQYETDSGQWAG